MTIDLMNLSEEEQINLYGYSDLFAVPEAMTRWNLRINNPVPSRYGYFAVVKIEQATIEMHHQIIVLDEHGEAAPNIGVGFFYPGGNGPSAPHPNRNYWRDPPIVNPAGNWQVANYGGYAQHTYNDGGETIVCWHMDDNGDLLYPSAAVYNAIWLDNSSQGTQDVRFLHTGVKVTFQLRRPEIVPMSRDMLRAKIADLEVRIAALEPIK
jgi:hypothetical protein